MSVKFAVSDEEWPLFDAIWWCMCGYHQSDSPADKFVSPIHFLEYLADEEFPWVSGEPGWTIIRLTLATYKARFSENPFDDAFVAILDSWKESGASTAYFIDHRDVTPKERIYSSAVFWRAVRESLLAFGVQHPERWPEIEEGFRQFTELGSFPGRLSH